MKYTVLITQATVLGVVEVTATIYSGIPASSLNISETRKTQAATFAPAMTLMTNWLNADLGSGEWLRYDKV